MHAGDGGGTESVEERGKKVDLCAKDRKRNSSSAQIGLANANANGLAFNKSLTLC